MNLSPLSPFKFNFRSPGSQVDGPIQYAVGQSALGIVLIGRSQRGICAIFLSDQASALHEELIATFPSIELRAAQTTLNHQLQQVIAFLVHGAVDETIELDIGGSPFQQTVWQMLCSIPAGQTRSYREVAQHLGIPDAVRAVAGACAANKHAIVIPCHRVVRSNGSISGYRWGVARKRALLDDEAERSRSVELGHIQ